MAKHLSVILKDMDSPKALSLLLRKPAVLSEEQLLTSTIVLEAAAEPISGQMAVANVIRNRVIRTGQTYHQVILRRLQFSCWNDLEWAEKRMHDESVKTLRQCVWIAIGILKGFIWYDSSNGADHYFNHNIVKPVWYAKNLDKVTARILNHTFMRLIPYDKPRGT